MSAPGLCPRAAAEDTRGPGSSTSQEQQWHARRGPTPGAAKRSPQEGPTGSWTASFTNLFVFKKGLAFLTGGYLVLSVTVRCLTLSFVGRWKQSSAEFFSPFFIVLTLLCLHVHVLESECGLGFAGQWAMLMGESLDGNCPQWRCWVTPHRQAGNRGLLFSPTCVGAKPLKMALF